MSALELYLKDVKCPFMRIETEYQPCDDDLITIDSITYKVLGRSFTVDYSENIRMRAIRCNCIVEVKGKSGMDHPLPPAPVICQIYGHVVGHCAECNVGVEAEENEQNAIDAARYRYIKEAGKMLVTDDFLMGGECKFAEDLDAEIDAAMTLKGEGNV